jgi:transaldolase
MLLVDTADPVLLADALAFPGVQGFTTNPTLIARAAGVESLSREDYVRAARGLCGFAARTPAVRHFMIQAVGDGDEAVAQAAVYSGDIRPQANQTLWIKLAPTRASLGSCRRISELGCATLATAVFTPTQAYVAMEAGADGVAVYLGRLMRAGGDWRAQLAQIVEIVRDAEKLLLLASFQTRESIEAGLAFSRDLTLPPSLLEELLASAQADAAMEAFDARIVPTLRG